MQSPKMFRDGERFGIRLLRPEQAPRDSSVGHGKATPDKPRRRLYVGAAIAACVLLGLLVGRALALGSEPLEVVVARPQHGPVVERIQTVALGRVSARRELTLRAELATRVAGVARRVGDRVQAGETLLELDPAPLEQELRAAEQTLASARAAELEAALRADLSRKRERRLEALSGTAITAAEQESRRFERKIAEQSALAATARSGEQRARVNALRHELERTKLRAPFDGTVLSVWAEESQSLQPAAPLVTLADVSALHVRAELDEADAERVKLGMQVELTFEGSEGPPLRRPITAVDPSITSNEQGRRVVRIEVDLPANSGLLVGRGAQVDVIVAESQRALVVPPTALLGSGPRRQLWVRSGDGAEPRAVQLGIVGWDAVEIRSGLAATDWVLQNPAAAKNAAGQALRFAETVDPAAARSEGDRSAR